MTEARTNKIEAVIADCEAKGIVWTNLLVYEAVGGKYQQVSQYLKQRRARLAVAASVAQAEAPVVGTDEATKDTPAAIQEHGERCIDAPSVPAPLPVAAAPDAPAEPCVPDAPVPRPIPKLETLQQAARDADAALVRLTRERDTQQQAAQLAALALYQARRDAHRLTGALRAAVRQAARHARPSRP